MLKNKKYLISPNISDDTLTQKIEGKDQDNNKNNINVINEESLTIFFHFF